MIGIEQYQKIQEYKELGLAQTKTAKALGITYTSVSKYWNMSKEDYAREAEQEKYHMDNYRQYKLEQLKICLQIRDTNIYLKLMEAFPDLQVKRATFYRYMKALREQHGYQHTSKRKSRHVKSRHQDMKLRLILVNTNLKICMDELCGYIS